MKKTFKQFIVAAFAIVIGATGLSMPALADCSGVGGGVSGGVNCASEGQDKRELFGPSGIFTTVVNFLLFLIGIIAVLMIIYGGIQYSLSAGDSGKITNAKNTILYAVVGLIIAILAFAIVNFVSGTFTGK